MKQLAGKLLLLFATTALFWIGGEILLRQLVGASDDTPLYTSTSDPFVPRLIPNVLARRHGVEVRTNALGLRGPEATEHGPEGIPRIVCLGDSYTFGTGVEEDDTIPAQLARVTGAEVLNMGIEGANAYDNEARLIHIGLDLEPDLVVLFFLFNDVHRMERGRAWMAARSRNPEAARREHDAGGRRSLVFHYLRSRVGALVRRVDRDAGRLGVWNDQYREGVPAWEQTQSALLAMRDACGEAGVDLVLAVMPAFARFTGDAYPLLDYRREVVAFCGASGIPVVDLHEPFWGEGGRRYWINPMDPHPNASACERMASALGDGLRALGLPRAP